MNDLPPAQPYRDERGFTLIEVLFAATVCLVGLMAVISTFDSSRRLISAAERTEVVSQRAEREIEETISRPYDQVGLQLSPIPAHSTDPDHPDNRIATGGGQYQWRTSPSQYSALVMDGALEHSSDWSDDASRLSGTVYRYITYYNDPSLPGADDGRRVTVAVTVAGRRRAVTTTTIIRDGS